MLLKKRVQIRPKTLTVSEYAESSIFATYSCINQMRLFIAGRDKI
jgi:hypothetical protein